MSGNTITICNTAGQALFEAPREEGADLRGAQIGERVGMAVELAVRKGVSLSGAMLTGVDLSNRNLTGADLRGAVLSDCNGERTILEAADLRGSDLRGGYFHYADFSRALMGGAIANQDTSFYFADFKGANFQGGISSIGLAWFQDADLRGADLRGVELAKNISAMAWVDSTTQMGPVNGIYRGLHICRNKIKQWRQLGSPQNGRHEAKLRNPRHP